MKKIILLIIAIMIISMSVPVYAQTPIPDPPIGAYEYWVVYQYVDGKVYLASSPYPIKVTMDQNNRPKFQFYNLREYVYQDGDWSYALERLGKIGTYFENIYASNHNIEWHPDHGSGFFFTPPKVSTLYQTAREMKSQGAFGMIWRIILDGLIPLVGLIVLAISLRKGWAFLQDQLKH